MIEVRIQVDGHRCLKTLDAGGHASDGSGLFGQNVVCAAVSSLIRSALASIAGNADVDAEGRSAGPGSLGIRVTGVSVGEQEWLRGVSSVLIDGLAWIEGQEPNELHVDIQELKNGT